MHWTDPKKAERYNESLGVLLNDPHAKLKEEIRQAMRQGRKVFLIVREKKGEGQVDKDVRFP